MEWDSTEGTVLITFIALFGLVIVTWGLKEYVGVDLFQNSYEFLRYITETIGSNIPVFAIFIYLIVISFFLNDKPKVDSPLFYGLLIIVPLLISIFYLFSGNIFESFTSAFSSAREYLSPAIILKTLVAFVVLYGPRNRRQNQPRTHL